MALKTTGISGENNQFAFFRLVHLRSARLVGVRRRGRRIDDRRIGDRAGSHLQSLRRQMPLCLVEQPLAQIVRFEQVTEPAHCRLVGHRLAAEVDADKAAHRRSIVECILPPPGQTGRTIVARNRCAASTRLPPAGHCPASDRTARSARTAPTTAQLFHLSKKRGPPRHLSVAAQTPLRSASIASSPPNSTSTLPPLYYNHCDWPLQRFPSS